MSFETDSKSTNFGAVGELTTVERDADQPDLLFVSRGSGVPVTGSIAGKRFQRPAKRGLRVSFLPRGADASTTFGTAAQSTNLIFLRSQLRDLVAEAGPIEFSPLIYREDERLIQLVQLLQREVATPGFAGKLMIDGLMRAMAALLADLRVERHAAEAARIHMAPAKLRRVVDYVEAHLEDGVTLTELASIAGLSVFHFARVFKRATGASPYQFVRERRLEFSRKLLAEGEMSLAEVALASGFANQSHFTAAFSREIGMSPARFRAVSRL